MADHSLTTMVAGFYNKLNEETNFLCRLNEGDLRDAVKDTFNELHDDIKKRYYGSGINVPELVQGKRILDIGCGSGSLVFILSKMVGPSGYVVGVDITSGLIETANSTKDFHMKKFGYSQPNCEFRECNVERLEELSFGPNSFDIVVSNGVYCLVPDKEKAFRGVFNLLKEGGQFMLNDVYAEKSPPEEHKNNETLWSLGTTGAMRWDELSTMARSVGFTTPYLMCAAPVNVVKEEYNKMLENGRFTCAGWRLFKPRSGAAKQGASAVTYNGNIPLHPQALPWDVDITFQKGTPVNVDGELATILANSYLSSSFTLQPSSSNPTTHRNQNPFALMDKLKAEGKLPEPIYKIE